MEYLVDVIMPVYNHEKYIVQAIESIVHQKTNFNFRLIIGEDCSTDSSRAIITKYAAAYPDKIFPALHEKNKGASGNGAYLLTAATSKYVAICEGDDYWTDEYKLQKQVDFLEANPDFTICFTKVQILNEKGIVRSGDSAFSYGEKDVFTIEDFITSTVNIVPTPTLLFRNVLPKPIPAFYVNMFSGDYCMHLWLTDKGNAKLLPDVTAVYRNHSTGVTKSELFIQKEFEIAFEMVEIFNEYFNYKYDKLMRKRLLETTKTMLIFGSRNKKGLGKIRHYFNTMPKYLKYSDKIDIKELIYYHAILFFPWALKIKK